MAKSSVEAYGAEGEQKVLLIPPERLKLITDPKHPLYDKRVHLPVDEGLVESIIAQGILENIRIRKNPDNPEDIEVVFGRQRVKACLEANKRLKKSGGVLINMPCMVSRSDAATLFGFTIAENVHRQEETPLGKAEKAQRLLDLGKSEEYAAMTLGVKVPTLRSLLRLLEAPSVVKKAVESGAISTDTAYKLGKHAPEEQKARLEKILREAPREVKKGGKKAKSGSAKRAKEIATGKASLRSAKEIQAARKSLEGPTLWGDVSNCTGVALSMLDWMLGQGELPWTTSEKEKAAE
jgi:ParB family chromosome partitioning protein